MARAEIAVETSRRAALPTARSGTVAWTILAALRASQECYPRPIGVLLHLEDIAGQTEWNVIARRGNQRWLQERAGGQVSAVILIADEDRTHQPSAVLVRYRDGANFAAS